MGTHPIFESDFDCLTEIQRIQVMQTLADLLFKSITSGVTKTSDQVEYIQCRLYTQFQRTTSDEACLSISDGLDLFGLIIDKERRLFIERFPNTESLPRGDSLPPLSPMVSDGGNETPNKTTRYELTGKARKKLLIDWDAARESADEEEEAEEKDATKLTSIEKLKQKLADKVSEREQLPDESQDLFEKEELDHEVSKLSSDENDGDEEATESDHDPPLEAPQLEETFIVEKTESISESQIWFKCDKDGPRCHKRFVATDFDKHNKQYHEEQDRSVENDELETGEANDNEPNKISFADPIFNTDTEDDESMDQRGESRTVQVTAEQLQFYVKPFSIKMDRLTADEIASWKAPPPQRTPPQIDSDDGSDDESPIRIMKRVRKRSTEIDSDEDSENDHRQQSFRRSPRCAQKMIPLSAQLKRGRVRPRKL